MVIWLYSADGNIWQDVKTQHMITSALRLYIWEECVRWIPVGYVWIIQRISGFRVRIRHFDRKAHGPWSLAMSDTTRLILWWKRRNSPVSEVTFLRSLFSIETKCCERRATWWIVVSSNSEKKCAKQKISVYHIKSSRNWSILLAKLGERQVLLTYW